MHPADPNEDVPEEFRRRRAAIEAAARAERQPQGPQARAAAVASEYWFVAHSLAIDPTGSSGFAGFDLDNRCTTEGAKTGCGAGDVVSDLDLDQNVGGCSGTNCQGCVDNAVPVIADVLSASEQRNMRSILTDAVNNGRAVWLVRLVAVESLQNDSRILLALYRGYSVDATCSALFTGSGQFVVSNSSLWIAGNVNYPKWFGEGSIVNGRFDIRFGSNGAAQSPTGAVVWSEFTNTPEALTLTTYQLRLRAQLNPSGLSANAGNAGTWAIADDFREAICRAFPQARGSIDGIVPLAADLPYHGQCGGLFGEPRGAIGLGLRYALAAATITGTVSTPPVSGCGAP
jgi:hypothetical protein